ncbi:MAG: L-seryl-tRNA(Sec) selenium transferase [Anaerolineae bacterium]|nr:MAG: L-seryl-tRNA(Sec) selenium transferase [Anaerolineae bacterium]
MSLRDLPSVDRLLSADQADELITAYGRPLTVQALRTSLESARLAIQQGQDVPEEADLISGTRATLQSWLLPSLRPVINATGVIIHTNLGRAPLSADAQRAVSDVASGYSSLEYDLERGARGSRDVHAEHLLVRLTGAESALVVNNNAAAVLLVLTVLAHEMEVLVSRTQLIEIGGGFRIPQIMEQSGAILREVGTTNRTHLKDFEGALTDRTALILRVHHSNFKIVGFATEPSLPELIDVGHKHDLPVLDDLGSGALLDTAQFGLGHEPMVQESIREGAHLVAFSGDKLVGGPQAGILVGEKALIDRLARHPMARAVRPDKMCLAGLSATLNHFMMDEASDAVPVWMMIAASEDQLMRRAGEWVQQLETGEVVPGRSTVGGGSLPEETLPTSLLALDVPHPNAFADRLRKADPPIVARVENDHVMIDPRTVLPGQEQTLLSGLAAALNE